MGGSKAIRAGFYATGALAAALFGASLAVAQDATLPGEIDLSDPALALTADQPAVTISARDDASPRFSPVNPGAPTEVEGPPHRLELSLAAGGGDSPVDVSIAQRASLGSNAEGEIDRTGSGQELRVGRGLVRDRGREASAEPSVYMFVASDDEALTWQPGSRNDFGGSRSSLSLQEERVEIGDMSAGVTYERNGVQASLAYVERDQSARVGGRTYSQDQAFTGVTVTVRH